MTVLEEELPPEIAFQILQFLHEDSLVDLRSLSETCYAWNQMVAAFVQHRWSRPSSPPYTHHDGLIQRLFHQDSLTFSLLLNDVCHNSPLPKSVMNHKEKGVCLRLQSTIRRTLQDQQQRAAHFWTSSSLLQQNMVQDLRQQMSDRFLDAISLQHKLAMHLYTHTSIGVILVTVVSIGLFFVKTQDELDIRSTHSPLFSISGSFPEEEEMLPGSPFYMRFLVVLAFASTVAYGIHKQTKSQQRKRERGLRRSVSQPELTEHSKGKSRGGNSPMKRCQTVASGLSSLDLLSESGTTVENPESCLPLWSLGLDDDALTVPTDREPVVSTGLSVEYSEERKTEELIVSFHRSPPRGCVGIFHRAVEHANERLVHLVQEHRSQSFGGFAPAERAEISAAFLNACSNDNSLETVRALSRSLPTQQFYIAPDGTESCALHVAAFHGSAQIIDFLCRGIDAVYDLSNENVNALLTVDDGGLCDVNVTDANGWTALHYAAGANSVNAVRVLVEHHGAKLNIPAVNGYTPLQWAMRLQHHAVAELLRSYIESENVQCQKRYIRQLWRQVQKSLPSILIFAFLLFYIISKNHI